MQSRFQDFLDETPVTQVELAGLLGLEPSAVSKKVSGDRPWKGHEINLVLAHLTERLRRPVTYEEAFIAAPAVEVK
jgi:predicted transcriptional regulator